MWTTGDSMGFDTLPTLEDEMDTLGRHCAAGSSLWDRFWFLLQTWALPKNSIPKPNIIKYHQISSNIITYHHISSHITCCQMLSNIWSKIIKPVEPKSFQPAADDLPGGQSRLQGPRVATGAGAILSSSHWIGGQGSTREWWMHTFCASKKARYFWGAIQCVVRTCLQRRLPACSNPQKDKHDLRLFWYESSSLSGCYNRSSNDCATPAFWTEVSCEHQL